MRPEGRGLTSLGVGRPVPVEGEAMTARDALHQHVVADLDVGRYGEAPETVGAPMDNDRDIEASHRLNQDAVVAP